MDMSMLPSTLLCQLCLSPCYARSRHEQHTYSQALLKGLLCTTQAPATHTKMSDTWLKQPCLSGTCHRHPGDPTHAQHHGKHSQGRGHAPVVHRTGCSRVYNKGPLQHTMQTVHDGWTKKHGGHRLYSQRAQTAYVQNSTMLCKYVLVGVDPQHGMTHR
jgi:hypothetical protein